jgi:hypothetical protein
MGAVWLPGDRVAIPLSEPRRERMPDPGDPDEKSETMQKLEEDPPKDLKDWPDDEDKYQTFGGPEGDHGYEEGPEAKLGPSGLRHHEDGSVEIDGEKVDDPEEYKSDPIPGGPTDPNATGPDVDNKAKDQDEDDSDSEKQSEDDSDDDG